MRDRFPLAMVGGVVLLGVLSWILIQGGRRGAFADRLSTFKSEPDGARALFLLLSESGLPIGRQQQDLTLIPPQRNLALLGTRFAVDQGVIEQDSESREKDGNGEDRDSEADEAEFKARGINALKSPPVSDEESTKLLEHVAQGATLLLVVGSYRDPKLLEDLDVSLERAEGSLSDRTLVPAQSNRYVHGVERVVTKVMAFLELPPEAVPLLVDDALDKPVAALIGYGQGQVIVLGAPELAMNRTLAAADNAQFWYSLAREISQSGPLLFDEFHHGFTGERSMGEFAARYGLHFAVGQLLVGVMLWALALRRFGSHRPPPEEVRVGSTDALFAASRLYREGRHHAHAAASILKHLSSDLAAVAGVSGRLDPAEIGAALELRGKKVLSRALLDIAHAAAATSSEADLERVATLAAVARKTLNHHPRTAP